MIRRLALGVLAAPLIIRPTLAQTWQGQAPSPSANVPGYGDQARRQVLAAMAVAMESAQLGSRMATHPAVKTFAQLEANEQEAFASARRMANLPLPEASMIDPQKREAMQRMQSLQGREFDRVFINNQIEGHQELQRLHQTVANSPESKEEAMLATVAVPAIRSHLAMLEGLREAVAQQRG